MNVPRIVAMSDAISAIFRLSISASTRALSANGCSQLSNVNCCHTALNLPFGSLKLNATITKIGRNR